MPVGSDIQALDFNAIRSKVIEIIGPGSGQKGYGQPIASSSVFAGNNITAAQWDGLKLDLINIKLHQDGVPPPITDVASGDVIRYTAGQPNYNYNSIIDQASLAKFNIGTGQSIVATKASQTTTATWSTQAQCTLTVSFPGGYTVTNADSTSWTASQSDHARNFFNSGCKIRFSSSRTGGAVTQQNGAWTNLLNTTVGTVSFGAAVPASVNFYSLTTSYQPMVTFNSSTPYSSNYFGIEALCNCTDATNVNGTATQVTFRITWRDNYTDYPGPTPPGDVVDGTLSISIEELKASGPLLPSGAFSILSPTYSISSITTV